MGYFQVRYDTIVVIYERKLFIRLATESGADYFDARYEIGNIRVQSFVLVKFQVVQI